MILCISIVVGGLLLVMGLVFSANAILSGGAVIWTIVGLRHYWRRESA